MAQFSPATEVDFVVIGSGAGGSIMAKQLSTAGFTVVVLEQGGWGKYGKEQEYTKDEYLNDNGGIDYQLMSDPVRQPNTFPPTDKDTATPGTHSYGCVVGGGTVAYGGNDRRHPPWGFNQATVARGGPSGAGSGRPLPWEFNEATVTGGVPGTGLQDWPITYEELEPYYVQAEWEMGISGMRIDSPFLAPMSKDYPVPPVPLKSSGALM